MQSRKSLRTHWPILLLTCLLLILLFFTYSTADTQTSILHVQVSNGAGTQQISLWESSEGIQYLFLPSGCSLSEVVIQLDTTAAVTIDGNRIQNGQSLEDFDVGKTYTMEVLLNSYPFQILQSSNVSTLYLDTASGSMKAIHADKSNSESVIVTLVTPEGSLDYFGENCTIKGRGNSTWEYEKRPYLLNFTEATDLLDMGAANKWVLLANATDESNLRNKLIYDLASKTGMRWTPQCEYVDVYLNGEYAGLYLLAERVEVGENRLNLADDPDSFLCKVDLSDRLATLENPIVTELGRAVEITDPSNISGAHTDAIAAKVQQLEDAILGGQIEDILDLDSWAIRLLIDEITENLDGDRASSYFYYTGGKFYAGPIWDYDHIWGTRDTNLNPEALLATSRLKAPDKPTPYNNALYENPVFYARMVEIYETTLLPLFQELTDGGIEALGEEISAASTMNSIRWRHMYDYWNRLKMTAADLTEFLNRRLIFLNSVWLDGKTYYSVQVEIDANLNYYNYAVEPGAFFDPIILAELTGLEDPTWVNAETGEIYDPAQPVMCDLQLNLKQETRASVDQVHKDSWLTLIYTGILLIGIATAIIWECNWNRKKRRRKHETVGR